jgi:predicted metallo-beta-lactamase superfamily hydrolase
MGARSLCTYIETPDIKILMDPGVSLGRRWNLLPHPTEYRILMDSRKRIAEFADKSEVVTLSHYHFDHCTPSFIDYLWTFSNPEASIQLFHDKVVLAKNYRNKINPTQRKRGWMLRKQIDDVVKEFHPADGRTFTFGETVIHFSKPVYHGEYETALGWVVMVWVSVEAERVLHASDIQGPMVPTTYQSILDIKPSLLYLGGPPQYLAGYRVDHHIIEQAQYYLRNLSRMIPTLIIDHHLLRSQDWMGFLQPIIDVAATRTHQAITAAEYRGLQNQPLEAKRRQLYDEDPPSTEFMNWSYLPQEQQKKIPPPV